MNKFLSSDRLCEENLKNLDDKIAKEVLNRERRETIIEERLDGGVTNSREMYPQKSARLGLHRADDRLSQTSSMPAIWKGVPNIGDQSDRVSVSTTSRP